jgi:hypothetical protein
LGAAPPLPQSVLVTLADTSAYELVAGYAPGIVPPSWLTFSVTGSGLQYSFAFFANQTNLAPGTYTTTVTIATVDANDNILQTRDVQVTYTIRDGVGVTSAPPVLTGVSGSSQSSQTFQVAVAAPAGLQWRATSSQPWLQPPSGTQTGPGNHTVTVDTSTVAPGQATATLTLTNVADATDTATLLVTVNMSAPILTTSLSAIALGGDSGLETAPVPLAFSLGTGTNAYPWTLTATTTSGGNWLTVSSASGTVASANVTVDVDADFQLATGTYTGQIELRATVNGVVLTRTLQVTLRIEGPRLLVTDTGVAFSSFPTRQVLTRALEVRDTRDETGIPWQATSSAAWLQTTLTGDTGDPLVLTADASALAVGQYFADVTVISPSPRIPNTETIRVGLTVGTTDPASSIDLPAANFGFLTATNPVEPEVFVATFPNPTAIEAYDVYSGVARAPLPWNGGNILSLAMSADGRNLYVYEDLAAGDRVFELDPVTGAVRRTFVLATNNGNAFAIGIAYARPDAHPVLLTAGGGEIFDAAVGTPFNARVDNGYSIDVSSNQRYVYTLNSGSSPATIYGYRLRYSSLSAGGLTSVRFLEQSGIASNGKDVAVAASDAAVYMASGYPYDFDALPGYGSSSIPLGLPGAPYPNNIETCWNGRVAGGADASSEPQGDIWVYDSAATLLARLDSSTGQNSVLATRSLTFSGDCTRLVSGSGVGLRIQNAP